MKKILLCLSIVLTLLCSCQKPLNNNEITVYCYDSFIGEYGPGEQLAKDFENETGIHVNLISCSGSVQLYTRILFEGESCSADAVIGLSDSINIDSSLFEIWEPSCKSDLISYSGNELIPFNYGVYAFIFNSDDSSITCPDCLEDLTKSEYKDKFILIDPRTSSVGLGLLKWSYACIGNGFEEWWAKVINNALTVADSWSSAYGLFTEGEAPLVISYSTSPIYHIEFEENEQYKALEFKNGHIKTEEYLAVLKSSSNKEATEKFCEYVLTKGQSSIALCNTMFPANIKTELPESYNKLINPNIVEIDNENFLKELDSLLDKWTKAVTE